MDNNQNIYNQNFNNQSFNNQNFSNQNIYNQNFNNNLGANNQVPKKKNNTVIIVIVVIIVALMGISKLIITTIAAVGPTTSYLSEARKGVFADNAISAISSVKYDVLVNGSNDSCYDLDEINSLIEAKLITSPFGTEYSNNSYVYVYDKNTYSMCLVDEDGNGFEYMSESEISSDKIRSNVKCALPVECR